MDYITSHKFVQDVWTHIYEGYQISLKKKIIFLLTLWKNRFMFLKLSKLTITSEERNFLYLTLQS